MGSDPKVRAGAVDGRVSAPRGSGVGSKAGSSGRGREDGLGCQSRDGAVTLWFEVLGTTSSWDLLLSSPLPGKWGFS